MTDIPTAFDELLCDLPYLMGRASAEGHEAGQRLAKEWQAKLRSAREALATTLPPPETDAGMVRDAEALRAFANDVMDDWPEGAPDGGDLQEIAEKHGLLKMTEKQVPCCENCGCNEYYSTGEIAECYTRTPRLTGPAIAAQKEPKW